VDEPLVSIVTTSYNQALFLEETIRSVLEQDYDRIEYVVVDDGSTDASAGIIELYAERLAWWTRQENAGQPAALNRGFAHTTGDVMAFLSSDDTLLPGAVSRVVWEFERDPSLVVVFGDVYLTDERSARLDYGDAAGSWDLARMARTAYAVYQPAMFWTRRAWTLAGPFNERSWSLFDVEFALRAALVGPAAHVAAPLATFRLHPKSKTMSGHTRMAEECVRFADEFFQGSSLPRELRRHARAGRANLYRRAALHYQADTDVRRARRLFLRSLLLSLRGLQRKQLVRLLRTLVPGD
jgi:glycosyltransferase involved in cell wall biosynthesis